MSVRHVAYFFDVALCTDVRTERRIDGFRSHGSIECSPKRNKLPRNDGMLHANAHTDHGSSPHLTPSYSYFMKSALLDGIVLFYDCVILLIRTRLMMLVVIIVFLQSISKSLLRNQQRLESA